MKPPADYLMARADEARVTRVWSALDGRLERARVRSQWLRAGLLLTAAGVLGLVMMGLRASHQPASVQTLQLADGSRVEHAVDAPVEVLQVTAERVELRLTRGRAHFEVTPNRARSFVTHAGEYTIRVLGTAYSVDLGAERVLLDVAHGEVEVSRDGSGERWRVRTGQHWQQRRGPQPTAADAARVGEPPPKAVPDAEPTVHALPPRAARSPAGDSRSAAAASAAPRPPASVPDAASSLLQRALAARDRPAESERLLEELLQRFPRDPRADLAAFQLGRARLERGDARGALAALERARRGDGAFREQIDARRVQALELLGEHDACQAARAAFLRDHPQGAFSAVVRQRCR